MIVTQKCFKIGCNQSNKNICCCECKTQTECPKISKLYENVRENIDLLQNLICNAEDRTFYCCNEEVEEPKPDEEVEEPKPDEGVEEPKPEEEVKEPKPEDSPTYLPTVNCGYPKVTPPSNVIGGEDTRIGEYPYTALLGSYINHTNNGTVKVKLCWNKLIWA